MVVFFARCICVVRARAARRALIYAKAILLPGMTNNYIVFLFAYSFLVKDKGEDLQTGFCSWGGGVVNQ